MVVAEVDTGGRDTHHDAVETLVADDEVGAAREEQQRHFLLVEQAHDLDQRRGGRAFDEIPGGATEPQGREFRQRHLLGHRGSRFDEPGLVRGSSTSKR